MQKILMTRLPGQTQTALLDNGALASFFVDMDHKPSMVGAVFIGKVVRSKPKAQQALVKLGLPGGYDEIYVSRSKQGPWPHEGQRTLVQITRDAMPGKRAIGTVDPVYGDRYLEYRARSAHDSSIDSGNGIPATLDTELGGHGGAWQAIRPIRQDDDVEAARTEAGELVKLAEAARAALNDGEIGQSVAPPRSGLDHVLKASPDPNPSVVFQNIGGSVLRQTPAVQKQQVGHWHQSGRLFETAGVDADFAEILLRRSTIADAQVTIDPAEALTAIDIDADAGTIRSPARQQALVCSVLERVRLLDLGGLIAIDLPGPVQRKAAIDGARGAARRDPLPLRFEPPGSFNVMLVSRRRARLSLLEQIHDPAGLAERRHNDDWIALQALAGVAQRWHAGEGHSFRLVVNEPVARLLASSLKPSVDALKNQMQGGLQVEARSPLPPSSAFEIHTS